MNASLTRRKFLSSAASASLGLSLAGRSRLHAASPNEKLNLGVIGVAGRGGENLREVAGENIVALCDVDDHRLREAATAHPGAATYRDFRRLLERKDLDAVVISTPDHTHAVAAVAALSSGRHVYCEKPLARTVSETRVVTDLARRQKRITQIGTQIHAGNNYRRVVEWVRSGVIGSVSEVHVWVNASYGNVELPKDTPPVPAYLDYDLWLGPVPYRPYSPEYVPFKWRNWWAFGGGALADFGCHYMDLPFWALGLKHPAAVEPIDGPPVHAESTPPWLIVRYQFPARESQPPVTLTWYHGGKQPQQLPAALAARWPSGVLFVGSKGQLLADYGRHVLLPEEQFKGVPRPDATIPNSIGHHKEWIQAIKTGGVTTCPFDYSGPLTETALLGNVAYRAGCKLEWNAAKLTALRCAEAGQYLQHHYREGWSL